jgi:hypothetical protein
MASPKLDLYMLDSYQLDTIMIADTSQYPSNFTISNATIEITPPNYSKVAISFEPRGVNIFRANDLSIDCSDDCVTLPDGIYKVKYSVTPNTTNYIEKQFIRVEEIRQSLRNAFAAVQFDTNILDTESKALKEKLRDADFLISGAIAATANCDIQSAYELYKKAEEILNKINCC